ncbi:MAG: (deoxy)nucleoside triphosphate pyrophosphohydrolase [Phycisphaeraceae bacterium]
MTSDAQTEQRVRVAIAAVVEKMSTAHADDPYRILITLRHAAQVLAHHWELPGGKVEPHETPRQAVVRELREEVGIAVEPLAQLPPVDHDYPHAAVRLIPFVCRRIAGKPSPVEVAQTRWVRPKDLDQHAFPKASLPVLESLRAWLRTTPDKALDDLPPLPLDRD